MLDDGVGILSFYDTRRRCYDTEMTTFLFGSCSFFRYCAESLV